MTISSVIFWLIFVLPLLAVLVWVLRQDKRKGNTGLLVLAIIVVGGIIYMFVMLKRRAEQDIQKSQYNAAIVSRLPFEGGVLRKLVA
jgi:cbb3-type cytochrome oxidase subunit 3